MFTNCLSKNLEYPRDLISSSLESLLKLMLDKDQNTRVDRGQTD